jgi:hypothetical protein
VTTSNHKQHQKQPQATTSNTRSDQKRPQATQKTKLDYF